RSDVMNEGQGLLARGEAAGETPRRRQRGSTCCALSVGPSPPIPGDDLPVNLFGSIPYFLRSLPRSRRSLPAARAARLTLPACSLIRRNKNRCSNVSIARRLDAVNECSVLSAAAFAVGDGSPSAAASTKSPGESWAARRM